MFYEKVKALCKEKGMSVSRMLLNLGMSKSSGSKWKDGHWPRVDILLKIAAYLEVDAAELLPKQGE